ncbi:hypothetical protein DL98DRAFT_240273 [Cadophora sp. DSE1049]|nr:hypothetical protein DL98DRAFT_240273 [Cadophora sp. DSE1049]
MLYQIRFLATQFAPIHARVEDMQQNKRSWNQSHVYAKREQHPGLLPHEQSRNIEITRRKGLWHRSPNFSTSHLGNLYFNQESFHETSLNIRRFKVISPNPRHNLSQMTDPTVRLKNKTKITDLLPDPMQGYSTPEMRMKHQRGEWGNRYKG